MRLWQYGVFTYSLSVYAFLAIVPWYEAAICGALLAGFAWMVWLFLRVMTLPLVNVFFQLSIRGKVVAGIGSIYFIIFVSILPSTSFLYAVFAPLFLIALLPAVLTVLGYIFVPLIAVLAGSFLPGEE